MRDIEVNTSELNSAHFYLEIPRLKGGEELPGGKQASSTVLEAWYPSSMI